MTPPFPRAVIFDWDNTLVDSWDSIGTAMNATFAHYGMPAWTMEQMRTGCTRAAKDYFPALFGDTWKEAFDVYYKAFDAIRTKHAPMAMTGSGDLLRWLQERKIPAFVVSNKSTAYLRQEAEALKWTGYFVALIGAQDVANNKPARDAADLALSKGNMKADDPSIWFVGDTDVDIQCARNAGCTPVLIGTAEDAVKFAVPLWFTDCRALLDHLKAT